MASLSMTKKSLEVDSGSILSRVTPQLLKEEVLTFSTGFRQKAEVKRLVGPYEFNGSTGANYLSSVSRFLPRYITEKRYDAKPQVPTHSLSRPVDRLLSTTSVCM